MLNNARVILPFLTEPAEPAEEPALSEAEGISWRPHEILRFAPLAQDDTVIACLRNSAAFARPRLLLARLRDIKVLDLGEVLAADVREVGVGGVAQRRLRHVEPHPLEPLDLAAV